MYMVTVILPCYPGIYNNNILGFKDYLLEQNQLYWYVLWLGRIYLMRKIPCSVVKRFFLVPCLVGKILVRRLFFSYCYETVPYL